MGKEKFMPKPSAATTQSSFKLDIDWEYYWNGLKNLVPKITIYPITLLHYILATINAIIYVLLFVVMVGQTAHMLNSPDRKFINLRHLMIKWVALIVITTLSRLTSTSGL